ncbi:aprataxin and PNK-like factor isoform X2 [Trachinotus anak]|uniref:aprataxin and PNK-like factor isoform X2 n=1 Tax=Trachinotus anak TaxID=443729 RepID=UPI0039F221FD
MSGFDLVPVDGGTPVHLPPGETVLGRGPLLGVSDKRVSRHHGLLENLDGQLRLKPTHLNPIFIQSLLDDENPRSLNKDSWYPLHHGDVFSLLPGQFIYKVVAVGGEECTPRNSQALEEEEKELPGSPEPDVEPAHPVRPDRGRTPPHREPTALANEEDDSPHTSLNKGDSALPEKEGGRSDVAPPVTKRRVLPAWMMVAAAPHGASSRPKGQSAPTRASTSSKPAAAKQATPTAASSPEEAGLSEEEKRPRKRRRKISDEEEEAGTKTDVPSEEPTLRYQRGSNRSEVSDKSDNFTMEEEEEEEEEEEGEGGGEPSSADRTTTTQTSDITESEKMEKSNNRAESVGSKGGSAPSKARLRTPCPYGKDCYRKNPLHRKEYKHTKKPARTTRAVRRSPADDEDEDSFINDDSEDVGDDSDYVPPDSDDSGKEDVKRLQKEAQVFLKRRK